MKLDFDFFALYDTDIIQQLTGLPENILAHRQPPPMQQGRFTGLQEPELIHSLYVLNYPAAYSRLKKLTHLLSPKDAMAACLCALSGTSQLLNRVLDHCPPIPEFQFQGVGAVSSLLAAAAGYGKDRALDILLNRGADPGRGPDGQESPLEAAFISGSYFSLQRLLEVPGLDVSLTPPMLEAWGELRQNSPSPLRFWSCQLLAEQILGQPVLPFEPVPIPPQLRLGHALRNNNLELALRICEERPITTEEFQDARTFFSDIFQTTLLTKQDPERPLQAWEEPLRFLLGFLAARPDTLEEPEIRSAVAKMALALPEADPELARWVERLADGPVTIRELPFVYTPPKKPAFLPFQPLFAPSSLDGTFFTRWEERLGSRLLPTMDRNAYLPFSCMPQEDIRLVLTHVSFAGEASPGKLSLMASGALLYAPEDLLPQLLQPGALLAEEPAALLLDACQTLPIGRRNAILPHIRKEVRYAL